MKLMRWTGAALALALAAPAWGVGSLADLAVFDRSEGRRLPVYWHEGRAWVVGKPGNDYQVSVKSRRGEDLLAVMSVDGINVVTGETASPQHSGYVLAPWRALEVKGWRKSLERTAAFYFTELPDSYAARTGRPDNVGVIGVALFNRKRVEQPHDIAPLSRRQAPAAADAAGASGSTRAEAEAPLAERDTKLGTGHGRSENSQARYVEFERASSSPAETIAIHYDSYRNLVARGVIREPATTVPVPRPFPGFVPDPRG